MKNLSVVRFPRPLKVILLSTLLLSATSAFAQEGEGNTQFRSMYYTVGYKKMPGKAQGSGITYGAGLKYKWYGMEFYSADMRDMPKGMERYINGVGVKGTDTNETVISDKGFGIDYNLYYPVFRHFEIYGGASTAFEKEAKVYSATDNPYISTGTKYADGIGTWKTRIGGQAGIMCYIPTGWHGMTVAFYPEKIEVIVNSHQVATHKRSFAKKQTIEHPTHRTDLLQITPAYKEKRIYLLMTRMDADIERFVTIAAQDGHAAFTSTHILFKLLVRFGKPCLLSAVREALSQKITRPDLVAAMLARPVSPVVCPVTPHDGTLMTIAYEERSLACYDPT